jgi:hypothetical protein
MPIRRPARQTLVRVAKSLMGLGFVLLFMTLYTWFLYDDTRPTVPNRVEGRVYEMNTHGHAVYLTLEESIRLYGLLTAGAICWGGGIWVGYKTQGLV